MKKTLLAALLMAVPFSTMAATKSTGNVDVYYTDADIDDNTPGGDDQGDGFGIRGAGKFSDQAYVYGEYQSSNYDDSDIDLDQIRAGVGYIFSKDANLDLYGKGEFINLQADGAGVDESESGFGVHGGLGFMVAPQFRLFGEIGYVDVGDFGDGMEYNVGASYDFSNQFGAVANYRVTSLKDGDIGSDLDISDLQVGVRFNF